MSRSPQRQGVGGPRGDAGGGVSGPRLLGSALLGVGTFVLGFLATYVLKSDTISSQQFGDGPGTEHYVSWVFYKMHNVGHQVSASSGGRSQSQSFDPSTWPMWEDWLFAVPPTLLLGGGVLAGVLWADGDLKTGATYGAALTAGYLPLATLGGFLAQYSDSTSSFGSSVSFTAGPKLVEALVLAGGVYPLAFGVVGGVVAAAVTGSSSAGAGPHPNAPPGGRQPRQGRPQQQRQQGGQRRQQGRQRQGGQQRQQGGQRRQGNQQRQQGGQRRQQRRQNQRRQDHQNQRRQGQGGGGGRRRQRDDQNGSDDRRE